jgi:pimeloyl-ACP methyl ester carboxylesterase
MMTLNYPAPANDARRVLLVMLPGAGIEAGAFAAQGMVAQVHSRGLNVDMIAAAPELDLYLDGAAGPALHRAVIEPALAQGYDRIWVLGISLGGMGALLLARDCAARLEGLVLLAPFLGTPGTIAAVAAAGGLAAWQGGGSGTEPERRILTWLQRRPARPAIHLGFGEADRFARGHRMLAEHLPAEFVLREPGGHDWETWYVLWRRMLDGGILK